MSAAARKNATKHNKWTTTPERNTTQTKALQWDLAIRLMLISRSYLNATIIRICSCCIVWTQHHPKQFSTLFLLLTRFFSPEASWFILLDGPTQSDDILILAWLKLFTNIGTFSFYSFICSFICHIILESIHFRFSCDFFT